MLFARAGPRARRQGDDRAVRVVAADVHRAALHRRAGEPPRRRDVVRKGIRVATNYVIKQFYQQMFFFLTPLYASSATWSLSSWNWWLAPLLLVCAVLSTMDLVFDNFIMERRWLASAMYGLAMFGVLNVLLPLVVGRRSPDRPHRRRRRDAGLGRAAVVLGPPGAVAAGRAADARDDRRAARRACGTGARSIPPAPLAMPETAVGHGTPGSYECLPASKHRDPREPARRPALRLAAARARRAQGAGRPRVDATAATRSRAIDARSAAAATATASCSAATSRRSSCRRIRPACGRARRTRSAASSSASASSRC